MTMSVVAERAELEPRGGVGAQQLEIAAAMASVGSGQPLSRLLHPSAALSPLAALLGSLPRPLSIISAVTSLMLHANA